MWMSLASAPCELRTLGDRFGFVSCALSSSKMEFSFCTLDDDVVDRLRFDSL